MISYHTFFLDSCEPSKDFNGDEALQVTVTFGTTAEKTAFLDHLELLLSYNLDKETEGTE